MLWNEKYKDYDLSEAMGVCNTRRGFSPQARLTDIVELVEYKMVYPYELTNAYSKKPLTDKNDFGWGKTMTVKQVLKELGPSRGWTVSDLHDFKTGHHDPVIVVDELACDGFGRCSLAQAWGEKVKAAFFKKRNVVAAVLAKYIVASDYGDWIENEDSYALPGNDQYFPIENVYVPTIDRNPVYEESISEYMEKSKPAVTGWSWKPNSAVDVPKKERWRKISPKKVNPKYPLLMVDDGVHRTTAAFKLGEKWVRATPQLDPSKGLRGGVPVKD